VLYAIEHMIEIELPGDAAACVDELDEIERLKSALCAR
jgi:Ni,Fe-hydrogenase III large subunit